MERLRKDLQKKFIGKTMKKESGHGTQKIGKKDELELSKTNVKYVVAKKY